MVQKVSKIGNLAVILFMQIRRSKTQNFAWEQGLSDSAYLNYAKKSSSRLLPKNAPNIHISQKSHLTITGKDIFVLTIAEKIA